MLKKTLLLICVPVSFIYLKAQDLSVITNTVDVYSSNSINGSSKYNAMAGSMGALGGDISSSNVNPAGIGVFIVNDLNLTLGVNSNKNATSLAGKTFNYNINKTNISNAGGVLSINLDNTNSKWKFINIGVNYSMQSIENYVESPGNDNIKIVDDFSFENRIVNYTYKGHAYDRYGDQSKLNFTVGANYDNQLYFGAGINFHNTNLTQNDVGVFHSDYDNTVSNYQKQYTPFEENSNGISANIGVIAKLGNQFRVGAAIESPTWWNIERAYSQYYFNNSDYDTFSENRNLSTPMKASLSAAFVPNKNFALNVDFIQGITKPNYTNSGDPGTELNDFFKDTYKNSSEIRIGAEYRIEGFRLRGGYANQGNNFQNISMLAFNTNGSISDQSFSNLFVANRNIIGFGIGYDFQSFYVDASYQNITSKYKNPFLQGNSDYNSGYFDGLFDVNSEAYAVSEVKNTRNNFFLTLGWKF